MLPGGYWGNLAAMSTYSAVDDPYIEKVLATWGLRMTTEQEQWFMDHAEILKLHYADKLEFVETTDGKFGVIVYQFAQRARDGSRFMTECPHGTRHAAREMPLLRMLDRLPADDILYAPEPLTHRFDDET